MVGFGNVESLTPSSFWNLEMVRFSLFGIWVPHVAMSVYRDHSQFFFSVRGQLVRLCVVETVAMFFLAIYISALILAMKWLMRSLATQQHATPQTW